MLRHNVLICVPAVSVSSVSEALYPSNLLYLCFPPARVAVAQSSSLSLFTNRDAELEQRAMLLKRLAFTIYSSEVDQYQKYLPDIQGKPRTHTCSSETKFPKI